LDVARIKAKIDTGAKTSAIHVFHLRTAEVDGKLHAEFFLHPEQNQSLPEVFCRAPVASKRAIRSSNGAVQERFIVKTHLRLGERTFMIDLSLASRDEMGFRLLLGRDAFHGRFLIDPDASFLLGE
jgi:hypothetical protein